MGIFSQRTSTSSDITADEAFLRAESLAEASDPSEALGWYRRAATAGHLEAMFKLGCHSLRVGNVSGGLRWLRTAADAGFGPAIFRMCRQADEVGDEDEAIRWLRKLAQSGRPKFARELAVRLEVRGKLEDALRWYTIAADGGDADSMFRAGMVQEKRQHIDEAVAWYTKAAEAGVRDAMYNLGVWMGRRGDLEKTAHWHELAAEAGDVDAMASLGFLNEELGNLQGAFNWYERAADAGHPESMVRSTYVNLLLTRRDLGPPKPRVNKAAPGIHRPRFAEFGCKRHIFSLGALRVIPPQETYVIQTVAAAITPYPAPTRRMTHEKRDHRTRRNLRRNSGVSRASINLRTSTRRRQRRTGCRQEISLRKRSRASQCLMTSRSPSRS